MLAAQLPETAESSVEVARGTGEWRVGPAGDVSCHVQDIQSAIDNTQANDGGNSTIHVRVSGSEAFHQGNTYTIDATGFDNVETFRITGGYDSCSDTSPSGHTVLNADGNDRVFDLRYDAADGDPIRTIVLENLEITGGNASFAGGGVRVEGHSGRHRVRFNNVAIHNNTTNNVGSGGGVSIEATAGSTASTSWISFSQGSVIHDNVADGAGGGLACFNTVGTSNPPVVMFETSIERNEAVFDGGGISINGCRQVRISMSISENQPKSVEQELALRGATEESVVANNQAGGGEEEGNGGGLSVVNGGQVLVEASGTSTPALIGSNVASNGGGVHVSGGLSRVELVNSVLSGNSAGNGGGLYVDNLGEVVMGRVGGVTGIPGDCSDLIARCSRLFANDASSGGAVAVHGGGSAHINQTFITNNDGSTLFGNGAVAAISGSNSLLSLEGAVIHSNGNANELMQATDNAHLRVRWSTIAGNTFGDLLRVIQLESSSSLELDNSIVWQPDRDIVRSIDETGSSDAFCLIGHDSAGDSGIDSTVFYSQIDPGLVDPENGDLRLSPTSPAVDYCDDTIAPEHDDMFHNSRGVDVGGPLTEPTDAPGGSFDIGAHELQSLSEEIFHDRFEAD